MRDGMEMANLRARANASVEHDVPVPATGGAVALAEQRQGDLAGANLTGAGLSGANLTGFRDDIWAVLSSAPAEAPAVLTRLSDRWRKL